jgi:hypothetical protein
MIKKEIEKCYMCNLEGKTREHVPPKCLFPEKKDVGHVKYRENLITVPSCEMHNSGKSKDDEFLMVSIAGIVGNNSIGYLHNAGKVSRAVRRTSNKLLSKVFSKRKSFKVRLKNNKFISIIEVTPDLARLIRCFEHIAYGVYRHHFGKSFVGELKIFPGFLNSQDKSPENFKKFVKHRFDIDTYGKNKMGNNKSIFYYQFIDEDEAGLIGLKICFYEGVDVFIAYKPDGTETPFNLGVALMNDGVKTVFKLEGKEYEIN